MSEINRYSHELFARVKMEYDQIHDDFKYAAGSALVDFQRSVSKISLEAERKTFKEVTSR